MTVLYTLHTTLQPANNSKSNVCRTTDWLEKEKKKKSTYIGFVLCPCTFLNMLLSCRGSKNVCLNTKMVNLNISQITPEKQNWEGLWFSEKRKKGHAYYSGLCNILRRIRYFCGIYTSYVFYLASRHSNSAHAISSLWHTRTHTFCIAHPETVFELFIYYQAIVT